MKEETRMQTITTLERPVELLCEYMTNPVALDTPAPRFSWKLTSKRRGEKQAAYHILVADQEDLLVQDTGNMWDSGKMDSGLSTQVVYGGRELSSGRIYYWKVRCWDSRGIPGEWSLQGSFGMGLLQEQNWQGCWITGASGSENPLFRKEFRLEKPVREARLYICGLGYYELYLNGNRVGDRLLDPAWTDYDQRRISGMLYPFDDQTTKRALYVAYDIKEYLREQNALGVMLGNGWYNQRRRNVEGNLWYGLPKMVLQLDIVYQDGSICQVASDETWKTSTGPLLSNNIYFGEVYDARLEQKGWDCPGFTDSGWQAAAKAQKPAGSLRVQTTPPDRAVRLLRPLAMTHPAEGVYVYDMGQNLSGWTKLTVTGPAGTAVTLRYAEELEKDGRLDVESAGGSGQVQCDTYILRGEDTECYQPRFTWHGFRYVELLGYPGVPGLETLEGVFVHADLETVGSFNCSSPLLNRIQQCYQWTQLSNLHGGVPSDCPHRERLGYTGDAQLLAESVMYNLDAACFYTKWVEDLGDAQNKTSGFVPHTAPFYGGGGGPAWGSAYVLVPWFMYLHYGDKRILEQHYEGMRHWVDYLAARPKKGCIVNREEPESWCLGDWLPPGGVEALKLPPELVNTFYFGYCAEIMARVAQVLGKAAEAIELEALRGRICMDFNDEFFHKKEGFYSIGYQGADVFPLACGFVPEEYREKVLQHLVRHLEYEREERLDTGILGTRFLFDVLVDHNRVDLAYRLIHHSRYPGYGYMLEQGATTLWEDWEGGASHNHPMFGSVSAWFYSRLAGIRPDAEKPGYEGIIICPAIPQGLDAAEATVKTIRGQVRAAWRKTAEGLEMKVEVPVGSAARVFLPTTAPAAATVLENGLTVWSRGVFQGAEGITSAVSDGHAVVVAIGSGSYNFLLVS